MFEAKLKQVSQRSLRGVHEARRAAPPDRTPPSPSRPAFHTLSPLPAMPPFPLTFQGGILKKIVEAVKDLVVTANLDCSADGIALQAMDPSHVALVSLRLSTEGFDDYRCDRNLSLGINMVSRRGLSALAVCCSARPPPASSSLTRLPPLFPRPLACRLTWPRSSSAPATMTC